VAMSVSPMPPKFGVVVQDGMGKRTILALGAAIVVFGRHPPPDTDFQLLDPLVAKRHFEIRWNARAVTHEVVDYGARFSPTLNDDVLRGECRALVPGDVVAHGSPVVLGSGQSIGHRYDQGRGFNAGHGAFDWGAVSARSHFRRSPSSVAA
jgi:hypothetical protein